MLGRKYATPGNACVATVTEKKQALSAAAAELGAM